MTSYKAWSRKKKEQAGIAVIKGTDLMQRLMLVKTI
jgi:hypothetical protein